MDISIVVEGQEGLTWDRWREVVRLADRLRLSTLYRSDHFFTGAQDESLEAYLSFAVAAIESTHIRLGPMVTPITFRSPVDIGRMAAQLDVLSGGRFVLGLGIGWYEEEHRVYGIPFPPVGERFDRLEEVISVCRALWTQPSADFDGRYYSLRGAQCLPKPAGRLPVLLGGVGERRALRIVAESADEWCSECLSLADYAHKVAVLERHCAAVSRDPATIRRSMIIVGDVVPNARRMVRVAGKHVLHTAGLRKIEPMPFEVPTRAGGFVAGGRQQLVDRLGEYAALGLQEAVFKHHDLASDDLLEFLAADVAPAVARV
jgi:F420-dependent oxidoreductase-like protein